MKILFYVVFITNLLCVFVSHGFLNLVTCAYGNDSSMELKPHDMENAYLLAKKGGNESSFIYEKDIIVIDELDTEIKKEVPQQKVTVKEKEKETKSKKEISHSLKLAYEYIEKGKKYEARNLLSDLYFAETDLKKRNKIKAELDMLNAELVFSAAPSPDAVIYFVKPGDTLIKIASQFNTTYESIMRINNKGRSTIKVGERLKVLNGKISLLIDKSNFTLTVLLNGHFIKQYPIGIGKYDKTPEEVFIVKNKLKNPVWYSPEGVYQFGDPRNLLGSRWIGFEDKGEFYGYGIHGTKEPETIGRAMSNGCIRLRNDDVEELYDYVTLKTEAVIQK